MWVCDYDGGEHLFKDGRCLLCGTMEYKCPCGRKATYICECGCLCCEEDPCIYNCGGSVFPLSIGLQKGIKPLIEED